MPVPCVPRKFYSVRERHRNREHARRIENFPSRSCNIRLFIARRWWLHFGRQPTPQPITWNYWIFDGYSDLFFINWYALYILWIQISQFLSAQREFGQLSGRSILEAMECCTSTECSKAQRASRKCVYYSGIFILLSARKSPSSEFVCIRWKWLLSGHSIRQWTAQHSIRWGEAIGCDTGSCISYHNRS